MSLQSTIQELAPNQQRFLLRKIAESIIGHYNQQKAADLRKKQQAAKQQQEQAEIEKLKQELENMYSQ